MSIIGATGKFPEGKIDETDEGELAMAIYNDINRKIVGVNFGKEISWFALPKGTAETFAFMLYEKSEEIVNGGETNSLKIIVGIDEEHKVLDIQFKEKISQLILNKEECLKFVNSIFEGVNKL